MTAKPSRNATTLKACGQLMFGDDWLEPLARGLRVTPELLDAMIAGREPIPAGIWDELDICMASMQGRKLRGRKVRLQ